MGETSSFSTWQGPRAWLATAASNGSFFGKLALAADERGAGRPAHPSRCPPAEDTRRSSFQDQTEGSFVSCAWEKQIPHSRGHLQGAGNVNRAEAGERSPWAAAPMLPRSREPDTAGSTR